MNGVWGGAAGPLASGNYQPVRPVPQSDVGGRGYTPNRYGNPMPIAPSVETGIPSPHGYTPSRNGMPLYIMPEQGIPQTANSPAQPSFSKYNLPPEIQELMRLVQSLRQR